MGFNKKACDGVRKTIARLQNELDDKLRPLRAKLHAFQSECPHSGEIETVLQSVTKTTYLCKECGKRWDYIPSRV